MKAIRSTTLYWLPTLAYMALIWMLSSIPKTAPIMIFQMQDKLVHLVEYGILAILSFYSILRTWPHWQKRTVFLLSVFLAALWGAIDEWHQSFVPNRNADIMDAVADALGAIIGSGFLLVLGAPRGKTRRPIDDRG